MRPVSDSLPFAGISPPGGLMDETPRLRFLSLSYP